MNWFWIGVLLGFGIGFNAAGLVYWTLYRRVVRTIRTELAKVQVEHAVIEKAVADALSEARGEKPRPEMRQ